MLSTPHKVDDHENHVRCIYLTTFLYTGQSQEYAIIPKWSEKIERWQKIYWIVITWLKPLGRRCPSINRWRVRNVRGGLIWPRWRERKYRVGIYFVFFWLKLAVFMVIRQYWKAPILYMLYEILWVVIVVPCTQKNHVLCTQLAILQSYSTTNL